MREARPWWKRRLVAAALALGLSLLMVSALLILVMADSSDSGGLGWHRCGSTQYFAIPRSHYVVLFVFLAFLIIDRFGPTVRGHRWWWIVPGACCALTLWLLVSFGVRLYLHYVPLFGVFIGH